MRMRGLEPPRPYGHTDLNRARLPIPPHPRALDSSRRDRFGHAARKPQRSRDVTVIMIRLLGLLLALALLALPAANGWRSDPRHGEALREVVVTLHSSPLAGRSTVAHRAAVDRQQARFASRLRESIPEATIRWRYRIVLNGAAVVLPERALSRLARLPGVETVDAGASYTAATVTDADVNRAARRWQAGLPNRGNGVKIAIIDDGIDQRHPYFAPGGIHDAGRGSPRARAPTRRRRSSSREHSHRRRLPGGSPASRSIRGNPSTARMSPESRRATPARS